MDEMLSELATVAANDVEYSTPLYDTVLSSTTEYGAGGIDSENSTLDSTGDNSVENETTFSAFDETEGFSLEATSMDVGKEQ